MYGFKLTLSGSSKAGYDIVGLGCGPQIHGRPLGEFGNYLHVRALCQLWFECVSPVTEAMKEAKKTSSTPPSSEELQLLPEIILRVTVHADATNPSGVRRVGSDSIEVHNAGAVFEVCDGDVVYMACSEDGKSFQGAVQVNELPRALTSHLSSLVEPSAPDLYIRESDAPSSDFDKSFHSTLRDLDVATHGLNAGEIFKRAEQNLQGA